MKNLILLLTMSLFAFSPVQDTSKLPSATPPLSAAVCGTGTYLLLLGNQTLGRETFEIKCAADGGYNASGNTKLDIPGASMDLNTTLETDRTGTPLKFSMKGSGGGQAIDQVITFNKDVATVVNDGKSSDVPYHGAAVFNSNVAYSYQFLLGRYDVAKGGPQKIAIFPNVEVTIERTARDAVQPVGIATTASMPFDRYSLQLGPANIVLWTDDKGRLAVWHVPTQKVTAVREDYQAFAQPLRAALLASVKGLVPDYSAPPNASFTAEEVQVQGKGLTLAGTLLLPKNAKGRFPVVVTSTGSGQQTRDEPLPIPGLEEYRLFRQIAETLASRGIAVLRCDDRGVGDSTGFQTLNDATTADFADDVRAQVAYLRTRADIDPDRIVIIGHSEGGAIAPLVAASDKRIAAIILMAGPGKMGEEVLRFQFNYPYDSDPKLTKEEKDKRHQETEDYLRVLKSGGDTSKYPPVIRRLNAPWTRWFLQYEPLTTIRKVPQPILILQGGLDQQVTAEQATMLLEAAKAAGNKDVTLKVFANLNHLFLPAKTGSETEYASLASTKLGDDVLTIIADWSTARLMPGK